MATKHFCDGCGRERSITDLTTVTITWQRSPVGQEEERKFDLDRGCLVEFQDKFPNKWPAPSLSAPPKPFDPDEDIPF